MGNASAFFSALIAALWTWTLIGLAAFVGYQISQGQTVETIPGFGLLPDFLKVPLQHQTDNTIVLTLAGVLGGFLLFFLVGYVWQALVDFVRLALVKGSVARARKGGRLTQPSQNLITWRWFYYPRMTRLWQEYAETLHRQTLPARPDQPSQVCYRSTVAAETIFSTQALVDLPMRVEFFRHLPGILTGAGIVSTFAGILLGLSQFNPSVEAQQIAYQLKNLFGGITTAFIASFFAIFTAILVTIVEKFLLHWRYAQVATLQHYMDDLFRAGIESEYLAHLVNHGQPGALQLQTEMGRLIDSLAAQVPTATPPAATPSAIQPLMPYANPSMPGDRLHETDSIQTVLSGFLVDLSQLLHRTMETYGRRREDGRAFEIQLISAGERLDVALGEFARAVVEAKSELNHNHALLQELLQRQLSLLEQMNGHLEQANKPQPQHPPVADLTAGLQQNLEHALRQLPDKGDIADLLAAIQGQHQSAADLALGLQKGLEQALRQAADKVDVVDLRTAIQGQHQSATDLALGLQKSLEQSLRQAPDKADIANLLMAIQGQQQVVTDLALGLQKGLEQGLHQVPGKGDVAGLLTAIQGQQQAVTDHLLGLQNSLEQSLRQVPDKREMADLLTAIQGQQQAVTDLALGLQKSLEQSLHQVPDKREMAGLLTAIQGQQQVVTDFATGLQQGLEQAVRQAADKADKADMVDLYTAIQAQQQAITAFATGLQQGLEQALRQAPDKADMVDLRTAIQDQQQAVTDLALGLQKGLEQAPDKTDMADLLTAIHGLRAGMVEAFVHPLQEATEQLTQQFARMEQELFQQHLQVENRLLDQLQDQFQANSAAVSTELANQVKALSRQSEQTTSTLVQTLAAQLVQDLNATLQAHTQTESSQEMAEKVTELLSDRLEQTFGGLSRGLSELRDRFSLERDAIVTTMEDWRADSSRSDMEKDQKIDQKISEVISHVNTHHSHLIQVIDTLNQNLSQDLNGMRGGLLSKSEESTRQMVEKVGDLGRVLEEVINTVGQEQTVFIEMLGERLEALRKRLRTK
ncbi:MAG: hypothetical protein HQL90_03735 [Magnetococcales bacterium]|nr:hypothetical protein [Magnetococcales bacterium]